MDEVMRLGAKIISLDKTNVHEILGGVTPVLLDFWAPWCMPCRAVDRLLKKLSERFCDKVVIAKINVDMQNEIMRRFDVRSIPTLILLNQQKEVFRFVASEYSEEYLLTQMEKNL